MDINVNVEGLNALTAKINAIKGLERNIQVDKALGRGGARMQGAVKMLTPVDTGNLRNKIFLNHEKLMEYAVETNVEYAVFVEFGTGRLGDPAVPHTSKESWTYYSEKLRHFVTTHGQEPVRMFTQGFNTMKNDVVRIVQTEIKEIIRNA